MEKKIIILYTANYCQKMKQQFGVDELVKYFQIEFWNLANITVHEKLAPVETDGLLEITVDSFKQFENLVISNSNDNTYFLTVIDYSTYSYRIHYLLSKYNAKLILATTGTFPTVNYTNSFKTISVKRIYNSVLNKLINIVLKTRIFKPADYVLLCSRKQNIIYKTDKKTKVIPYNTGDYQSYLDSKEISIDSSKYIVFIDQYIPFHNDFQVLGYSNIQPELYYDMINAYFSNLEKEYKCEVIIAAHPSASRYKENNYFGGRAVVFGQTSTLVKNSIGVLCHDTTAISYAVMYMKPMIMLHHKGLPEIINDDVFFLSNLLDCPAVDLSSISSKERFHIVNREKYLNYQYNYLTAFDANPVSNSEVIKNLIDGKYDRNY